MHDVKKNKKINETGVTTGDVMHSDKELHLGIFFQF